MRELEQIHSRQGHEATRKRSFAREIFQRHKKDLMTISSGLLATTTAAVTLYGAHDTITNNATRELDRFANALGPQITSLIDSNLETRGNDLVMITVAVTPPKGEDGSPREGLLTLGVSRDPQSKQIVAVEALEYVDELDHVADDDKRNKVVVSNMFSLRQVGGIWHASSREGDPETSIDNEKIAGVSLQLADVQEIEKRILYVYNKAKTREAINVPN